MAGARAPRCAPPWPAAWLAAACCCGRAVSLRNRPLRDPFSVYDGHDLLKVTACDAASAGELQRALTSASCRVLSEPGELRLPSGGGCAVAQASCPPEAAPRGNGVEVLAEASAGETMRRRGALHLTIPLDGEGGRLDLARNGSSAFYDFFRDYDAIEGRLRSLVNASRAGAELVELRPLTSQGRSILAVRLRGARWTPGAPRVIFTYTLHAREWISVMGGVYAVETLLETASQNPERFDNIEVTFVPLSNPDGFVFSTTSDRFWRKNLGKNSGCGGVDLNRNFNWQWGRTYEGDSFNQASTCGEVYHGAEPASEPETRALQALVEESPVSVLLDFHSCGGFVLGPWSFMLNAHPRHKEILELGGMLREAIRSHAGAVYQFCTGNSCLYPVAGALPDFATAAGGLGFTIEMRPTTGRFATYDDFAPEPSEIIVNAQENYNAVLAAIEWATARGSNASSSVPTVPAEEEPLGPAAL